MPWKIRLLARAPINGNAKIGDAWFLRETDEHFDFYRKQLSRYYRRHNTDRMPLFVVMPDRYPLMVDSAYIEGGRLHPEMAGWAVTGTPPNITLEPSVNIVGSYHGWIVNGVISEDCEGRKFPAE